jgi:hypothetical protein
MISEQTLIEKVPAIFTTAPHPKMSKKYNFLPTFDIIKNFEREGWVISSASQFGKSKFAAHEVRMRNGSLSNVGDSVVEALIGNSHNGYSTFSVSSGLFRLVCKNGLTVPTSVADKISVKHMTIDMGMVRQITDEFANRLPKIQNSVGRMESTYLNDEKTIDFVKKASLIRWGKDSVPENMNLEEFIKPERNEDYGNTVWKTFNIIQEKYIRGGNQYINRKGRLITMKELKNFQNINKINTSLWELAESYCD